MRKKSVSVIAVWLVFVLSLFCASCGSKTQLPSAEKPAVSVPESQQLRVLKMDEGLTQEQKNSRIKAEYLRENNGYKDTDEVIAVVTLSGDSLTDTYLAGGTGAASVAEYAASAAGKRQQKSIAAKQDSVLRGLRKQNLVDSVESRYSTVLNGFAVKTSYRNFKTIETLEGIDVMLSDTFNLPQSTSDTSAIENPVEVYDTGIFDSSSVRFTGKKTAVAVLDSGFDCSHQVFQSDLRPEDLLIDQTAVNNVLPNTNAAKNTPGIEISDVWYSAKIPFAYDYADQDVNVFPYDSEHGTHVAGIIGGVDVPEDGHKGVAVDTQLVLMKVFPDIDTGAESTTLLDALEDAVLLEVDAINMSLGKSCGFSRERDNDRLNDIYDSIERTGISLITAASNSYSSAQGGELGNTNKVTNPDSSTVGSPSTYHAAMSVASISGTKSHYIVGNGEQVFFFLESNTITGDQNDFVEQLGLTQPGQSHTYEYVTVPGVGERINYTAIDVRGKIALVRRGSNTFEDKAQQAKNAGAVGMIVYNNVEGDISMSIGKSKEFPVISISKADGNILASRASGTLTISYDYQAGPFMSDFSSWGPTPDLSLKPEITAHGGNIRSSVPNGRYDKQSGTSMASPNLCGIVVLIRQFLKKKYPAYSMSAINTLANQMLMSTASIVRNEEGNPYSPRKQGAGLASLRNVVETPAYLTVDGNNKTKLELKDDPKRTGVYTMQLNAVNTSDGPVQYTLGLLGMTESVSESDPEFVAEKAQMLSGDFTVTLQGAGELRGRTVTVNAGGTVSLKIVYTLSDADKSMMERLFPFGMYVEGFVTLTPLSEGVPLNAPFLAFYGDWTQAPMFDKTYFEVESEAHNAAIDEEDKLKADYVATTPYATYYYNYMIPMGKYLYDVDTALYDEIPASAEKIAVSDVFGTADGISSVYAGLLRGAREMQYSITDKLTGESVWTKTDWNTYKAHSNGGTPIPYGDYMNIRSTELGLINNRQYEFKMKGKLDYGEDGGEFTNVRNEFAFDFYMDNEAPVVKGATFEKVYDRTLKKDRFYINLTVYDNQYVQSISPVRFLRNPEAETDPTAPAYVYTTLTDNPIPVYGERGTDSTMRFEVTDYLNDLGTDAWYTFALAFAVDDYAMNSSLYVCSLPGVEGNLKFTQDGTFGGTAMTTISLYEDEILDLTQYLASDDPALDADKDYLQYLTWRISNPNRADVQNGQVRGLSAGTALITVSNVRSGSTASITVTVKRRGTKSVETAAMQKSALATANNVDNATNATAESIRFSYFTTEFAHPRAGQTSEIGETGSRMYITELPHIDAGPVLTVYPGESIRLTYDLQPWYVRDKYTVTYSSSNEGIVSVDQNGVVKALRRGAANIVLRVNGTNLMARMRVEVNSEFVIENRVLVAYKGLGGEVTIPDDEGILYIGPYAFCLYTTDHEIEMPEHDYDANKIPQTNNTVTKVIVPDGVTEIQKYAFYNCTALEEVVLPKAQGDKDVGSVKFIREFAFAGDISLQTIDLHSVFGAGERAFYGCEKLANADLTNLYSIGKEGFRGCKLLNNINLSALRNVGADTFRDCTALRNVTIGENTGLASGMFAGTAIENVSLYERVLIPADCFTGCKNLTTVTLLNSVVTIGNGAFADCEKLEKVILHGTIGRIGPSAFAGTKATFEAASGNDAYKIENNLLLSKDGKTVISAVPGADLSGGVTLPVTVERVAEGAFSGTNIGAITFTYANIEIGNAAFADCPLLSSVTFPQGGNVTVGDRAFCNGLSNKNSVTVRNLDSVKKAGQAAFSGVRWVNEKGENRIVLAGGAEFGEDAFRGCDALETVVFTTVSGKKTLFGDGAFYNCLQLAAVQISGDGLVHFGEGCFAGDTRLSFIDLSYADETIAAETFIGCESLTSVTLTNVKTIGNFAFANCARLTNLQMPKVEVIGNSAFAAYSTADAEGTGAGFTSITLPNTLVKIGRGAFFSCDKLVSVEIPSSVKTPATQNEAETAGIGDGVFSFCTALTSVALPVTVTEIPAYAFAGCKNLTTVNLGHVKSAGESAFSGCVKLANADLSALERADMLAFESTSIPSVTSGNLAYIGIAAFANNPALATVKLSGKLAFVGAQAFYNCPKLTNFRYGAGNATNGDVSENAKLIDGVLYTRLSLGGWQLSSVPAGKNTAKLEIPEGVVRIDNYAGNNNTRVQELVLPDSLRSVGHFAFYGYTGLQTVEFRSSVAPALENGDVPNTTAFKLTTSDPGYELLRNYSLFADDFLAYCNFIALAGKRAPVTMVLPAGDVSGYDSLIYEAYFGKASAAKRSDYVAMEINLRNFIEYATALMRVDTITLAQETLAEKAIAAYNACTQSGVSYGYSQEEWDAMVTAAQNASARVAALRLANASYTVRMLQARIDALPDTYSADLQPTLDALAAEIAALKPADRSILNLTKYNALRNAAGDNDHNDDDPPPESGCHCSVPAAASIALGLLFLGFGTIALWKRAAGKKA